MTIRRAEARGAVAARGWGVSLVAVLTVALVAGTAAAASGSSPVSAVAVSAGIALAYGVLFFTVVRKAAPGSAAAWAGTIATIVAAGSLTALVPSNGVLQFWAFPVLWALQRSLRTTFVTTAILALTVFAGFAISTGHEDGWLMTALLTQTISYAVNVGMGLWITSIYAYASERERLLAELTAVQDELAALHRDAGVHAERERLSREVHDTLAQSLTAAVLLVQRARRDLDDRAKTAESLDLVEDAVREALAETRGIVADGASVDLDGGGIAAAIDTLAQRFRRETSLAIDVDVRLTETLDREIEVALLRCAQEAFANIRKHSDARHVSVALHAEPTAATLTVRDDGRGYDTTTVSHGYGLDGLRARLALLGGTLDLDGTAGAVVVRARVPRTEQT